MEIPIVYILIGIMVLMGFITIGLEGLLGDRIAKFLWKLFT